MRRRRHRRSYTGYSGLKIPTSALLLGGAAVVAFIMLAGSKVEEAAGSAVQSVEDIAAGLAGKAKFIVQMWQAIGQALGDIPLQAKLYVIAQAGHECRWGAQGTFAQTNNAFNITCIIKPDGSHGDEWRGPWVDGPDTECDANGANCHPITQHWRKYDTLADSVTDFMQFISHSRYGNAKAQLLAGDAGYIDTLHAGGYFTENVNTYRNTIASFASDAQSTLSSVGLAGYRYTGPQLGLYVPVWLPTRRAA